MKISRMNWEEVYSINFNKSEEGTTRLKKISTQLKTIQAITKKNYQWPSVIITKKSENQSN